MVVYADMVFLLNLCIDSLILMLTAAIRRQRTSLWRIFTAALLGAVYAMAQLWDPLAVPHTMLIKLLVSLFMVWIALGYHSPLQYLRNVTVFYLISFVMGGGMFALHYILSGEAHVAGGVLFTASSGWGSPVSWVFVLVAFPLVWLYARFSFGSLQRRQIVNQYLAQVAITFGDQRLECTGLIDTGNQLRDPITRTPVMMVELEEIASYLPESLAVMVKEKNWGGMENQLPAEWMTRIRFVPFRGAGSDGGVMLVLKPDRVEVLHEQEWRESGKVLIGLDAGRLSSDGTYQAILHPSCMTQAS
ncbi:hypothetical protein GCM10011571_25690 [Marinithermofilum abyssi]|uniref:Sporulation sigma-E factor-processing peptidase n=1 Tax=Marinithermofilum abyssi TaxID=1571185 RepID=A0A8J2VII1_9BACL|nr:sigma-E processing peptidase SpoIIGA [Marinithermofilum abyssi]GGE22466.1 hypothetical protein GCM10011571_25690 [Marinithermofilum abyssi]